MDWQWMEIEGRANLWKRDVKKKKKKGERQRETSLNIIEIMLGLRNYVFLKTNLHLWSQSTGFWILELALWNPLGREVHPSSRNASWRPEWSLQCLWGQIEINMIYTSYRSLDILKLLKKVRGMEWNRRACVYAATEKWNKIGDVEGEKWERERQGRKERNKKSPIGLIILEVRSFLPSFFPWRLRRKVQMAASTKHSLDFDSVLGRKLL